MFSVRAVIRLNQIGCLNMAFPTGRAYPALITCNAPPFKHSYTKPSALYFSFQKTPQPSLSLSLFSFQPKPSRPSSHRQGFSLPPLAPSSALTCPCHPPAASRPVRRQVTDNLLLVPATGAGAGTMGKDNNKHQSEAAARCPACRNETPVSLESRYEVAPCSTANSQSSWRITSQWRRKEMNRGYVYSDEESKPLVFRWLPLRLFSITRSTVTLSSGLAVTLSGKKPQDCKT